MAPREPEDSVGSPLTARERLRLLVDEIAALLDECPDEDRTGMHDLAIRWVGDLQTRPVQIEASGADEQRRAGSATALLGYGALIVPVGLLVATVLPLGFVLSAVGIGMIMAGTLWALAARLRKPKGAESG